MLQSCKQILSQDSGIFMIEILKQKITALQSFAPSVDGRIVNTAVKRRFTV